jgi:cytochrome d ubiquinol oxidase subunit I
VMRTKDAVTDAGGIWVTFGLVLALYTALGAATILVLRSMARRWREGDAPDGQVPYGPGAGAPAATSTAGGSE